MSIFIHNFLTRYISDFFHRNRCIPFFCLRYALIMLIFWQGLSMEEILCPMYRVFIKYCVFPEIFMIFLNSASPAAALVFYLPVCTHTDNEGKQRKARVRNILKSTKKTQYLINTLYNTKSFLFYSYKSSLCHHLLAQRSDLCLSVYNIYQWSR